MTALMMMRMMNSSTQMRRRRDVKLWDGLGAGDFAGSAETIAFVAFAQEPHLWAPDANSPTDCPL